MPQAWREVIERLTWNGVRMERVDAERSVEASYYHLHGVSSRAHPYEGHMFHDDVKLEKRRARVTLRAGDYLVPLDQDAARYAIEMLEPQGHDSFFRWGFFNSVLEKKQASISAYAFEDTALEMLAEEPALRQAFDAWKAAHPEQLSDPQAVLGFLFTHGRRHAEPEWRRYPVAALM